MVPRFCILLPVRIIANLINVNVSYALKVLGEAGIDELTNHINSIFGVILAHIDAWGGDVVKFVGDALIVIW